MKPPVSLASAVKTTGVEGATVIATFQSSQPLSRPIAAPGVMAMAMRKSSQVAEGTRKEQTRAHPTVLDELDAPLPCSKRPWACWMAPDRTVVPRSGRRGRRFKSFHPDSRLRRSQPCDAGRPAARASSKVQL